MLEMLVAARRWLVLKLMDWHFAGKPLAVLEHDVEQTRFRMIGSYCDHDEQFGMSAIVDTTERIDMSASLQEIARRVQQNNLSFRAARFEFHSIEWDKARKMYVVRRYS